MTRSQATPASSQIIALEGMVQNLEQQLSAAQARIAELEEQIDLQIPKGVLVAQQARIQELREGITTMATQWSSQDKYDMLYVNGLLKTDDLSALDDLKARYEARIQELREALGVLAQCAIDAIETDHDIDEIIKRFNTSINSALSRTDDLSALEAAKSQAKREALMEAADHFAYGTSFELRRMAGGVK